MYPLYLFVRKKERIRQPKKNISCILYINGGNKQHLIFFFLVKKKLIFFHY